jgi:aconitate hydratase A / 2-methylisocitrate dehydratase
MTDPLVNEQGTTVKLDPPSGEELPPNGFTPGERGYVEPARNGVRIDVRVEPGSDRLQVLTPFAPWDGNDFIDLPVLVKAKGKCTTDHISPAGKWLKYRGHLDNISNNMFIGAVNAFTDEAGIGRNTFTGEKKEFSAVAREYKQMGTGWVAIGDENYGEGSSREHAAMEPRWLGGKAIIVRSFARIHETNLKKQGLLPLTFNDPADYDKVQEHDRISILGLQNLAPGKQVRMIIKHSDGSVDECLLNHTLNRNQIGWFKAGSALNLIAGRSKVSEKAKGPPAKAKVRAAKKLLRKPVKKSATAVRKPVKKSASARGGAMTTPRRVTRRSGKLAAARKPVKKSARNLRRRK